MVTIVRCDIRAKMVIQNTSYEISLDKLHSGQGESIIWRYSLRNRIATETLSQKRISETISQEDVFEERLFECVSTKMSSQATGCQKLCLSSKKID